MLTRARTLLLWLEHPMRNVCRLSHMYSNECRIFEKKERINPKEYSKLCVIHLIYLELSAYMSWIPFQMAAYYLALTMFLNTRKTELIFQRDVTCRFKHQFATESKLCLGGL